MQLTRSVRRTATAAVLGLGVAVWPAQSASALAPNYEFVAGNSGKCMDVAGGSTSNGARLQQYVCNGTSAQLFRTEPVGNGYYRIVNLASQKCLDVKDVSFADYAPVQQYTCHSGYNQHWEFRLMAGTFDWYQIIARHSDKCLTVASSSLEDRAPLVQEACGPLGTYNQNWQLRH